MDKLQKNKMSKPQIRQKMLQENPYNNPATLIYSNVIVDTPHLNH